MNIITSVKELSKITVILLVAGLLYVPYTLLNKYIMQPSYKLSHTFGSNDYIVELNEQISNDTLAYQNLADLIYTLQPSDTLTLRLHNYGGYVESAIVLINAMVDSKANIIAEVNGPSFSAGAVITCAAKQIRMSKYSFLMFHNPKAEETVLNSDLRFAINRVMNECIKHGILTQQDIDDINKNPTKEVYWYK